MDTRRNLTVLRKEWDDCGRCTLSATRDPKDKIVYEGGSVPADYLFIYDAPEREDAKSGFPLQGKAGSLLETLIYEADFPQKSFAFAPLVGCYPYVVLPATEDTKEETRDRDPDSDEIETCGERIRQIILNVDPRLIFAVGGLTWKALVKPRDRDRDNTIEAAAGKLYHTDVHGRLRRIRYPVMGLLPPKKLMANPSSAEHGPISTTLEALVRGKIYITNLKREENR